MAERIKRGDRKDGVWLKDLDPLHGFMPTGRTTRPLFRSR